jgi:MFS transporter, MHS family, proline/betaine transporter
LRVSEKTLYLIAFFATAIRYYDYALFGLSASVISSHFMPEGTNSDKLLNFFYNI